MSFTYGFYNSKNHDRQYDATQFSAIFDGLINDGVYEGYGDRFEVLATTGMSVTVGIGRAWFDHTWSLNDSLLPLVIEPTDLLLPRIDTIVLEVDRSLANRRNSIKVLVGTPSENPQPYPRSTEEYVTQYPLAYIHLAGGSTEITQSIIENAVGTSECPFVTGIVEVLSVDQFTRQWNAQWEEWFARRKTQVLNDMDEFEAWIAGFEGKYEAWINSFKNAAETDFNEWFLHLKNELDEHQAAHLQNEIDDAAEKEFKRYYDLDSVISNKIFDEKNELTGIEKESSEAVSTTTLNKNDKGDVISVITEIVPNEGSWKYIKTTILGEIQIMSTYVKEAK